MSQVRPTRRFEVQKSWIIKFIFTIGFASFAAGVLLVLIHPIYYLYLYPEQEVLIERVEKEFTTAATSNSLKIAEQQVTQMTTELDNYLQMHPLGKSSKDFLDWYQ